MTERKKRGWVTVDLKDLKEPWAALCGELKVTPTDVIRKLAQDMLGMAQEPSGRLVLAGMFQEIEGQAGKGRNRVEVGFTDDEREALELCINEGGFESLPQWVVALVRAYLAGTPQLSPAERTLLSESNRQLLGLGRNLNQIARVLSRGAGEGGDVAIDTEQIARLYSRIMQHTEYVSRLIAASTERWRLEHAKDA